MSMIFCHRCSVLVDSDIEPACFVEVTDYGDDGATIEVVLCERCRDREERNTDRAL